MQDVFSGAKFSDLFRTEGNIRLVFIRFELRQQRFMLVSPLGRYVYCDRNGKCMNIDDKYNVVEKL